jgi:hypothetical protein
MSPTATSAAHLALCSRAPDVNAVRVQNPHLRRTLLAGAALRRRVHWFDGRATCAVLDVSTGLGRDAHPHPAAFDMPSGRGTVRVIERRRRYLVKSPFAQAAHCVPQLRSLLLSRGLRLHLGVVTRVLKRAAQPYAVRIARGSLHAVSLSLVDGDRLALDARLVLKLRLEVET